MTSTYVSKGNYLNIDCWWEIETDVL